MTSLDKPASAKHSSLFCHEDSEEGKLQHGHLAGPLDPPDAGAVAVTSETPTSQEPSPA